MLRMPRTAAKHQLATIEKILIRKFPWGGYSLRPGEMPANSSVVDYNAFFSRPPDEVAGGFVRDFKFLF